MVFFDFFVEILETTEFFFRAKVPNYGRNGEGDKSN